MTDPRPLSSMTGFSRVQTAAPGGEAIVWELRSVNAKGFDLRLRTPPGFDALEAELRTRAKARFARGSVSAGLSVERAATAASVRIDEAQLAVYVERAQALVDAGLAAPPAADGLLALKGVLVSEEAASAGEADAAGDEALNEAILTSFDTALAALSEAREAEGAALAALLAGHVDEIARLTAQAAADPAASAGAIRDRLAQRLEDLLPKGYDEARLAQEAALLATRADVREEIDRLNAHVEAARALLTGGSPCGRKLDFLTQEFNREANTLCSKAADRSLTETGLALKAVVDQLREQVQNVE